MFTIKNRKNGGSGDAQPVGFPFQFWKFWKLFERKKETAIIEHTAADALDQYAYPEANRPNVLWDFYTLEGMDSQHNIDLATLTKAQQESLIIPDLMACLTGVRGKFIKPLPRNLEAAGLERYNTNFSLQNDLDRSLMEMVNDLLPLASHFVGIQRAMGATEGRGKVMSALNAELFQISRDFTALVVGDSLSNDEITLAKLQLYLQPTAWLMGELFNIVTQIQLRNLRGADVLTHLCDRIKQLGKDQNIRTTICELVSKSAFPYMKMVQLWIQKGVIRDNMQEFFVAIDESIKKSDISPEEYWQKRYTLRSECIPSFLEKQAEKILRSGKYMRMVKKYGKKAGSTLEFDLHFDPNNDNHVAVINDAHLFASRKLIEVLNEEHDLMGHFKSIRRYLLINQGDFISQFIDACENELSKKVRDVQVLKIKSAFDNALSASLAKWDNQKSNLLFTLLPYNLGQQKEERTQTNLDCTGLKCFLFDYKVDWPISLVLNNTAMNQYKMIFKQLFFCKYVERQLCQVWKESQEFFRLVYMLLQRMHNTVLDFVNFMLADVIEPNWSIFMEKLEEVKNIEMILELHNDFLNVCLKHHMFAKSSSINRVVNKICVVCLKYCDCIKSERPHSDPDEVTCYVKEYSKLFASFLKDINKVVKANPSDRFGPLLRRINFNEYYSPRLQKEI